ncbi:hypothetical protein Tco_0619692 [Tanacetum coccineum]
MMVVKEIVSRLLEEVEVTLFWEEGDDFGVDVLRFHTCLTDILGFLEKLEWWFEQDIDDEEENEESEGGSEGKSSLRFASSFLILLRMRMLDCIELMLQCNKGNMKTDTWRHDPYDLLDK